MFNPCSKRDDADRATTFENRIIYSLPVRMGLWYEDIALAEEKKQITSYKKDHCQLLVQKTKKMFRNILKQTDLAISSSFVIYGQNYQIKTTDLTQSTRPGGNNSSTTSCPEFKSGTNKGLYLSGLISDTEIESAQHFRHGCILTASTMNQCVVRNTFKFVGCRGNKYGEKVFCGDDIMIQISESADDIPLYICCENSTTDSFGEHLTVRLSRSPDIYCRFKFLHWDPHKRYETSGTAFSPNSRIIIQHAASGRNLAVESTARIPTFFGVECMVSCHTYRDTHKMETAENFWMLVSKSKSNKNLFVRAAKGENIPHDTFE